MTEPDGGSDLLGAMRTTAVRDGDEYVVNGAKMWITNANVADVGIVYAKTDPTPGTAACPRSSSRPRLRDSACSGCRAGCSAR